MHYFKQIINFLNSKLTRPLLLFLIFSLLFLNSKTEHNYYGLDEKTLLSEFNCTRLKTFFSLSFISLKNFCKDILEDEFRFNAVIHFIHIINIHSFDFFYQLAVCCYWGCGFFRLIYKNITFLKNFNSKFVGKSPLNSALLLFFFFLILGHLLAYLLEKNYVFCLNSSFFFFAPIALFFGPYAQRIVFILLAKLLPEQPSKENLLKLCFLDETIDNISWISFYLDWWWVSFYVFIWFTEQPKEDKSLYLFIFLFIYLFFLGKVVFKIF